MHPIFNWLLTFSSVLEIERLYKQTDARAHVNQYDIELSQSLSFSVRYFFKDIMTFTFEQFGQRDEVVLEPTMA